MTAESDDAQPVNIGKLISSAIDKFLYRPAMYLNEFMISDAGVILAESPNQTSCAAPVPFNDYTVGPVYAFQIAYIALFLPIFLQYWGSGSQRNMSVYFRRYFALAVCLMTPVFVQSEAETTIESQSNFAPLEFLVDHCWTAALPNKTIDTHCFTRTYKGAFLRDRHFVTGGPGVYCGETIFAWDATKQQVVFWYWASPGNFSNGVVEYEGSDIVFPERVETADGTKEYRSIWRQTNAGYRNILTEKTNDGWKTLWDTEFEKNDDATGEYEIFCGD